MRKDTLRLLYGGIAPREVRDNARLDAIAFFGGYYEPNQEPVTPTRVTGRNRLRLNPAGMKLYDIWFIPSGRKRLTKLIGIVQDPKFYIENGAEILEQRVLMEHTTNGTHLHNLGGSRLVITNRPDQTVLFECRWGLRDERIG